MPATPTSNVVQMPRVFGKTEQRARAVLEVLQAHPKREFTYDELGDLTGTPYDQLLYMLHAWAVSGTVIRSKVARGPGRPTTLFQIAGARAVGARSASQG
jgi:hypothetical protein